MDPSVRPSAVWQTLLPWYAAGSRWTKPIGELADQLTQSAVDALRLRFPSRTPSEASLAQIGRDRLIPRAPNEPAESYARRLILWLDLWSLAGTRLGLSYALQSYVFPGYPRIRIVTRDQLWSTLDEGASRDMNPLEACSLPCTPEPNLITSPYRWAPPIGSVTRAPFWLHSGTPLEFDWDSVSHPAYASRYFDYWVFVYRDSYEFQGEYNSGITYNSNTCWGLDIDPGTIQVFRELIRLYSRAGSHCMAVLFPRTNAMYDPEVGPDADWPDGRWGWESVDNGFGVSVTPRSINARYLLGFP